MIYAPRCAAPGCSQFIKTSRARLSAPDQIGRVLPCRAASQSLQEAVRRRRRRHRAAQSPGDSMVHPTSTGAWRREVGGRCCCASNSSPCLRRGGSDCCSQTALTERKPARGRVREERRTAASPPQEGAPRPKRRQDCKVRRFVFTFFSIFTVYIIQKSSAFTQKS